jgi:hypothetical protein
MTTVSSKKDFNSSNSCFKFFLCEDENSKNIIQCLKHATLKMPPQLAFGNNTYESNPIISVILAGGRK